MTISEAAMSRIVSASEFKAKCLAILDEVQATGEPVTVTKRGKPVAQLGPTPPPPGARPVLGMLKNPAYRFDDPATPVTADEEWDALR
jgi:prevent-host-death family protein